MPDITAHNLKEEFIKMKLLKRLFREEEGATAVEYGLMVALIAIVIIAAVALVGTNLQAVFERIAQNLSALPN